MLGLTIGEKHTYNDFRLKMLSSFVVSPPEPVVNKIQIPGMDGMLDISESLSNEVVYSNRTLSVKFLLEEQDEESQQRRMNEIYNYLHGRIHNICPDMDKDYEYNGRVTVSFTPIGCFYEVTILADVFPYKMKRGSTVVAQQVIEQATIICYNERKSVVPIIDVDADFRVKYGDLSVSLSAGKNLVPDIKFYQGFNKVVCYGTGNITFTYREGSL